MSAWDIKWGITGIEMVFECMRWDQVIQDLSVNLKIKKCKNEYQVLQYLMIQERKKSEKESEKELLVGKKKSVQGSEECCSPEVKERKYFKKVT